MRVALILLIARSCNAQLPYSQGEKEGQDNDEAKAGGTAVNAASFLSNLKSWHHHLCPWNGNACPKEFLQLPPMAGEDLRAGEGAFAAVRGV